MPRPACRGIDAPTRANNLVGMVSESRKEQTGDWLAPRAPGPVRAVVRLPGSKSMTNRALVLAALSDRPTVINGPLVARDTQLMADALSVLGCRIEQTPGSWLVEPAAAVRQRPGSVPASRPGIDVDVGNAGTVLRFVPPVAALTAADVTFRGDPRASRRPVGPLLIALRTMGVTISDTGTGAVPFVVRGRGAVPGGTVTMDASSSSQLVSGLLLAAARFGAGAEIRHAGPLVPSLPHIDMTVRMLQAAGVDVRADAGQRADGARPADRGPAADVITSRTWRVLPGPVRPAVIDVLQPSRVSISKRVIHRISIRVVFLAGIQSSASQRIRAQESACQWVIPTPHHVDERRRVFLLMAGETY